MKDTGVGRRLRAVALRPASPGGPPAHRWLLRPLATDEHRTQFWVRHLRLGVVLTEAVVALVVAYTILAHRPHLYAVLAIGVGVASGAPGMLALPMHRWALDSRGGLVFYGWSVMSTIMICVVALLDGGAGSPLLSLLILTLTFVGAAYPPVGVALMGCFIMAGYLTVAALTPSSTTLANLVATGGIWGCFTATTVWASRNQWDLLDDQASLAQQLVTLAETDELTACLNRRAFAARLDLRLQEVTPAAPLSLCVLDLDGFKRVNDSLGHAAGDAVLVCAARALRGALRDADSISRLGGDEFAVLLPDTTREQAWTTAGRLRGAVATAVGRQGVTASVGVITTTRPTSGEQLLASADVLMYEAKGAGGDGIRQPA